MGWDFRWVSSFGSSFNFDFHVTIDPAVAPVEYNYRDQAQLEADERRLARLVGRATGHERVRA